MLRWTPGGHLTVGAASAERAGAASALSETSAEFGGALGIAILGLVGTAAYRGQIANAIPAGVPPQAAAAARDTLGGAVAEAGQHPDQLGQALLGAARQAFTHGLHLAFAVSAAAATVVAILAVVLLRGMRPSSQPNGQPDLGPSPDAPKRGGRRASVQGYGRRP